MALPLEAEPPPCFQQARRPRSVGASLIISLGSCAFSESRAAKTYGVCEWPDGRRTNQCPGLLNALMWVRKSIFISEQMTHVSIGLVHAPASTYPWHWRINFQRGCNHNFYTNINEHTSKILFKSLMKELVRHYTCLKGNHEGWNEFTNGCKLVKLVNIHRAKISDVPLGTIYISVDRNYLHYYGRPISKMHTPPSPPPPLLHQDYLLPGVHASIIILHTPSWARPAIGQFLPCLGYITRQKWWGSDSCEWQPGERSSCWLWRSNPTCCEGIWLGPEDSLRAACRNWMIPGQ